MLRQHLLHSLAALVSFSVMTELAPSRADEIHTATQQGNLEQVKKILAKTPKAAGAPDKNNASFTPLHYAVQGAQKAILDELLKHKPDVNAKDGSGNTPLHYAVMYYR